MLAAALLVIGAAAVSMGSVAAHSELNSSQPSPGQPVGGDVQFIFLDFLTQVDEFTGTLEDPDGNLIGAHVGRPDNFSVLYEMDEPLSVEGQHVLRYTTVAADGFVEESALAFTYDESAPEFQITMPDGLGDRDEGPDWILIAGIGLIVIGIALLVGRRFRRSSTSESD
jgi:methionine-rich copper-binding protein CopC